MFVWEPSASFQLTPHKNEKLKCLEVSEMCHKINVHIPGPESVVTPGDPAVGRAEQR